MEKRERFAALDGLRAVFGMGIVIYHVNGAFGSAFSGVLAPVYAYGGYFGNYFFFLLSGFLTEFHKLPIGGGAICPPEPAAGPPVSRLCPFQFGDDGLRDGHPLSLENLCDVFDAVLCLDQRYAL